MKSKHTKGKAEVFENETISVDGYSIASVDISCRILNDWDRKGFRHWSDGAYIDINEKEALANAQLIADAFNVTNETGMTPRELQKSHAELLDALKNLLSSMDFGMRFNQLKHYEQAEQAINNATKQYHEKAHNKN